MSLRRRAFLRHDLPDPAAATPVRVGFVATGRVAAETTTPVVEDEV